MGDQPAVGVGLGEFGAEPHQPGPAHLDLLRGRTGHQPVRDPSRVGVSQGGAAGKKFTGAPYQPRRIEDLAAPVVAGQLVQQLIQQIRQMVQILGPGPGA